MWLTFRNLSRDNDTVFCINASKLYEHTHIFKLCKHNQSWLVRVILLLRAKTCSNRYQVNKIILPMINLIKKINYK